jgi:uncharacterized protein YqgC (DUF456 family)
VDWVWLLLGALLILIGLAGAVIPALPGPPLSLLGLGLLKFHSTAGPQLSWELLGWLIFFTVLVTVLDYLLPVWGTKIFGGTRAGKIGSTIGLIGGLFVPVLGPLTFLFGPLIGAVIGELIGGSDFRLAVKSGFGSFLGFLGGAFIKLLLCLVILYYFIKVLW